MKTQLPTRDELPKEFFEVSVRKNIFTALGDWAIVASAIFISLRFPSILTFLAAQVVIATRQHAFFILMHEGTHGVFLKNKKWNDIASDLLVAWPVGVSTRRYRLRHWLHHRYLNTDKDPDWTRKQNDAKWAFPMKPSQFWFHSAKYLLGFGVIEMSYAIKHIGPEKRDIPFVSFYFACMATVLTLTNTWSYFALYWALPYVTFLPFFHRIRYASEHMVLPKTHPVNNSRNIDCSFWEKFLFSQHNGHLHMIHHLYPYIPWHKLGDLRNYLMEFEDFKNNAIEPNSYFLPKTNNVYKALTQSKKEVVYEKHAA